MNLIIFATALTLTIFGTTIVCLALAAAGRPPRCTLCRGRIVLKYGGYSVCEKCDHIWAGDSYYRCDNYYR